MCTHRSLQEKVELLRRWETNPQWTLQEAAVQLAVKVNTLKGWYDRYWDDLDTISVSDRKRAKGDGRSRIIKPYEADVLRFYKSKGSNCRPRDVLAFRLGLNEFIQDKRKPDSQTSWMREFIKYYSKPENKPILQAEQRPPQPSRTEHTDDNNRVPEDNNCDGGNSVDEAVRDIAKNCEINDNNGGSGNIGDGDRSVCGTDNNSEVNDNNCGDSDYNYDSSNNNEDVDSYGGEGARGAITNSTNCGRSDQICGGGVNEMADVDGSVTIGNIESNNGSDGISGERVCGESFGCCGDDMGIDDTGNDGTGDDSDKSNEIGCDEGRQEYIIDSDYLENWDST